MEKGDGRGGRRSGGRRSGGKGRRGDGGKVVNVGEAFQSPAQRQRRETEGERRRALQRKHAVWKQPQCSGRLRLPLKGERARGKEERQQRQWQWALSFCFCLSSPSLSLSRWPSLLHEHRIRLQRQSLALSWRSQSVQTRAKGSSLFPWSVHSLSLSLLRRSSFPFRSVSHKTRTFAHKWRAMLTRRTRETSRQCQGRSHSSMLARSYSGKSDGTNDGPCSHCAMSPRTSCGSMLERKAAAIATERRREERKRGEVVDAPNGGDLVVV